MIPARGVLSRDGREISLDPKLLDLLRIFVDSPLRVISKDELVTRLWGGRAIGDDTLAALISRLRSALGETKTERYIETLPKRGYRWLIPPAEQAGKPAGRGARDPVDELIEKGKSALGLPLAPSLAQARVFFEGAIARDPKRARAHAGLAEVAIAQLLAGREAQSQLAPAAKTAAQIATALDENDPECWSALGVALLLSDREFAPADSALSRGLSLDQNSAAIHGRRAFAFATVGRFSEAEREARRAVECDPLSFAARNQLLQLLLLARRYSQAVAEAGRAIASNPQSFELWSAKGWAQALMGDEVSALASLRHGLELMGMDRRSLTTLDKAHERGGFAGVCTAGADLFESQHLIFAPRPLDIAMLRTYGGEFDKAMTSLELAASRDDPFLLFLPWLPHLDRLRNDPRFAVFSDGVRLVR